MATRTACGTARSWTLTRTAGQTSGAGAYARERLADRCVPLRGVMEDVGDQCFKEELPCGEALDEAHGAAAAGTRPR